MLPIFQKGVAEGMEVSAILKKSLPFWETLTYDQQQTLIRHSKINKYAKEEWVYDGDQEENCLWILCKGQIAFTLQTKRGTQMTFFRLSSQEVTVLPLFLDAMEDNSYFFQAIAEKETLLCRIENFTCGKIAINSKEAQMFFYKQLKNLIHQNIQLIWTLSFSDLKERLLSKLEEYTCLQNNKIIDVTHEGLACELGTSREVVSRLLKELEQERMIQLGRGRIEILF